MRISDWSSDVCSSDLRLIELVSSAELDGLDPDDYDPDELREVVKKARSGSSEALAKAELKLSRTFARYVSDVRRKPSIKITYLDRELQPERLTERSEEHTSELQSLMRISYAVLYFKKHT